MIKNTYLLLVLLVLSVSLASCKRIFDKDATYTYIIENKTGSVVKIAVEIKENPGIIRHGSPFSYYTLEPNSKVSVWSTSGFTTDEVYDEEKNNTELYWISVQASQSGSYQQHSFNSTSNWEYKKQSNYKATYTLVLAESSL